jgi:rare lipoprotein A
MNSMARIRLTVPALAFLVMGLSLNTGSAAQPADPPRLSSEVKPALDRSGRTRVGKASFYAAMFNGRKMADGTPMKPGANNAASRTLPLGTTARVTNLETGKTAVVTIRDRGPYVAGRIVDLSPATARQIGLDKKTGVTRVAVAPIAVPLADGAIKWGDGLLQASYRIEPADRSSSRSTARIEMRTRSP